MSHQLSKSTFMRGVKCEKSLYLNKHNKDLRDELPSQQEAIFNQGSKVGELAQQLFPGGIDLTTENFYDFSASIIKTKEAIDRGEKIIYEAAFLFDGVLAAMDILVKSENGYKAYEVKSSTEVKDVYIQDVALQTYVILNSGVHLEDVSVVFINNEYVKIGPIDIQQLFVLESVLEQIQNPLAAIPNQITQFKKVLSEATVPEVKIGPHCGSPYACDFTGHCWKDVPEYSVFDINRLPQKKRYELFNSGVLRLEEIPDDFKMGVNQRMQVEVEKSKSTIIDKKKINEFLSELNYPVYHLDFETMGHAVPIFDGSRPYQQIVFQYSLHVQKSPKAEPAHFEYLGETNGIDPRIKFVEQLIKDCGTTGDILVYNIGFERGKLNDLVELFPSKAIQLNVIITRLKDLMIPFQKRWFYNPAMRGSYSIKKVLPAIVPEFETAYKSLNIQEGGTASSTYAQMTDGSFQGNVEQTRKDLLAYCRLDTLAMVEILGRLYGV